MPRSEYVASTLQKHPGSPLFITGVAVFFVGFVHYWSGPRTDLDLAIMLITIPLMASYHYTGYHLQDEDISIRSILYLLLTAFTFWIFGGSIAGLFVGAHYLSGVPIDDELYLIFLVGTTTSAVGPPISYYYLRAESQREEISTLNQRLSVINRVLRHNIRNELTILTGSLRTIDSDETSEAVQQMENSTDRLLHLSNHAKTLRDVWETDETITVDVNQAIEQVVTRAEEKYPDVPIDTDLPVATTVDAHPKLEVALDEVTTNAIVHNDAASLTISIRVTPIPDASLVGIDIVDTGRGMPEGEIEWIGQPEETALEHSEGLGLWLTYWIIEKSGGKLDIESQCGDGTHVSLELPAAD